MILGWADAHPIFLLTRLVSAIHSVNSYSRILFLTFVSND